LVYLGVFGVFLDTRLLCFKIRNQKDVLAARLPIGIKNEKL